MAEATSTGASRRPVRPRPVLGEAWRRSGGWPGLVAATAPAVVFVATSTLAGLTVAVVAAGVAALAGFGLQVARGEGLRGAAAGVVLAGACALVAVLTGEARGFFLLTTAVPVVIVLACLGTLVARRPLTGLVFNRVAGGPVAWRRHPRLVRVYTVTTLITLGVSVVNASLRAFLYAVDQTAALAAVYAASGPVFAVLAAGTLVAVRRRLAGPLA